MQREATCKLHLGNDILAINAEEDEQFYLCGKCIQSMIRKNPNTSYIDIEEIESEDGVIFSEWNFIDRKLLSSVKAEIMKGENETHCFKESDVNQIFDKDCKEIMFLVENVKNLAIDQIKKLNNYSIQLKNVYNQYAQPQKLKSIYQQRETSEQELRQIFSEVRKNKDKIEKEFKDLIEEKEKINNLHFTKSIIKENIDRALVKGRQLDENVLEDTELAKKFKNFSIENIQLKPLIEQQKSNLSEKEKENIELKSQIEQLQSNLSEKERKLVSGEQEVESLNDNITEFKQEIEQYQSILREKEKQINDGNRDREQLQIKLEKINNEHTSINDSLFQRTKELEESKEKVKEMEAKQKTLEDSLTGKINELQDSANKLNEAMQNQQKIQDSKKEGDLQLEVAVKEKEDLRKQLETSQKSLEETKISLQATIGTKVGLEGALKNLQLQLEETNRNLVSKEYQRIAEERAKKIEDFEKELENTKSKVTEQEILNKTAQEKQRILQLENGSQLETNKQLKDYIDLQKTRFDSQKRNFEDIINEMNKEMEIILKNQANTRDNNRILYSVIGQSGRTSVGCGRQLVLLKCRNCNNKIKTDAISAQFDIKCGGYHEECGGMLYCNGGC